MGALEITRPSNFIQECVERESECVIYTHPSLKPLIYTSGINIHNGIGRYGDKLRAITNTQMCQNNNIKHMRMSYIHIEVYQ